MKITVYDENAFSMDHPRGTVSFNYLLMGDEQAAGELPVHPRPPGSRLHMPRHRHTFEQIRFPVVGDMNLGEQGILHEGEIGYFPEGQTYGPQDDPFGAREAALQLVLQFPGASGLGMAAGAGAARRRARRARGAGQRRGPSSPGRATRAC